MMMLSKIPYADVAQSVAHFTRNEGVAGSNPVISTKIEILYVLMLQDFFVVFKVIGNLLTNN